METSSGWLPLLASQRPSLAEVVVLPEPCSPVISITEGSREEVWQTRRLVAAEQRHHLVAHDADDGLGGGEAAQDLLAGGAHAHAVEELLDDLEVDVGLEEREADLAERLVDVGLGEGPLAAEGAEDVLELPA